MYLNQQTITYFASVDCWLLTVDIRHIDNWRLNRSMFLVCDETSFLLSFFLSEALKRYYTLLKDYWHLTNKPCIEFHFSQFNCKMVWLFCVLFVWLPDFLSFGSVLCQFKANKRKKERWHIVNYELCWFCGKCVQIAHDWNFSHITTISHTLEY